MNSTRHLFVLPSSYVFPGFHSHAVHFERFHVEKCRKVISYLHNLFLAAFEFRNFNPLYLKICEKLGIKFSLCINLTVNFSRQENLYLASSLCEYFKCNNLHRISNFCYTVKTLCFTMVP